MGLAQVSKLELIEALEVALGREGVSRDPARLRLCEQDLWGEGGRVLCIVMPACIADIQTLVQLAGAHGTPIVTRGGGASYSLATVAADAQDAIVLDMQGLDSILEIAPEDLYAVVEAGVTWKALGEALAPHGVRACFQGPLSGRVATVGGSASQNAIFWGSGQTGAMAQSVLGLEVVTGEGLVRRTGALGVADAPAFARFFGPDLAGPFLGDGGAFGIKTRIVLALEPLPRETRTFSFALPDIDSLLALLRASAREGLCTTQMAMDGRLQKARTTSSGWRSDLEEMWRLARGGPGLSGGLRRAMKVALAGRNLAGDAAFVSHHWVQGGNTPDVEARSDRLAELVRALGGVRVEPSVPQVMEATPFMPLNGITGPAGQRWVPVHGLFAHSRVRAAYEAIDDVVAQQREQMEALGVEFYYLFSSVGRGATVIEPMFFWPDELSPLHAQFLGETRLRKLTRHPPSLSARRLVRELREAVIGAMDGQGAMHMQVARSYPYRARLSPGTDDLLARLKRECDPAGIFNPGVLGLRTPFNLD